MADLRAELAALKRRVDEQEAENRANFGTVAVAIRKTRQQLVTAEVRSSVERLRPPTSLLDWTPRPGEPARPAIDDSLLDRLRKGEQVSGTLGNAEPVIGQTNLLRNALLESAPGVAFGAAPVRVLPHWSAHYVLNSGTAPANPVVDDLYQRGDPDNNPLNSAIVELGTGTSTNTYDADFYIYPTVDFSCDGISPLPWLVGACRVTRLGDAVGSSYATARARLELFDGASVVAASEWVTFADLAGTTGEVFPVRQLVVALGGTPADSYTWRLRINAVKTTAAAESAYIFFGEPQLHYAYSPDPLPFAPFVGSWVPVSLEARHSNEEFDSLELGLSGSGVPRLLFGGGTAALDWQLSRTAADVAEVAAGDTLNVLGALQLGGTGVSVIGHGAADHADVTRQAFLLPQGAGMDGTATLILVGGGPVNFSNAVNYPDAATSGAFWSWQVPDDYLSGVISVRPLWSPAATDGVAHTVRWSVSAKELATGSDVTAAGTTTAFTGISAARTVNILVTENLQSTGVTPSGAGARMRIELQRIGADGADTYVGAVRLLGLIVSWTASQ